MHLGNGALTPECALLTFAGAAAGLGALALVDRTPRDARRWWTAGPVAAAVFAAQMFNVPVTPHASAHLVGGVLAAWLLGPALGAATLAVVLALQAVLLGDGGLAALGANTLNMAVLPAGLVWLVRRAPSANSADMAVSPVRRSAALAAATFLSIVLAALLIVGQTALFRGGESLAAWPAFAASLLSAHLLIGVIEAAITVALVAAFEGALARGRLAPAVAATGAAAALLLAAGWWLSSELPDGYEAAVLGSGWSALVDDASAIGLNAQLAAWQAAVVAKFDVAGETLLGVLGVVAAGLLAAALALAPTRRRAAGS